MTKEKRLPAGGVRREGVASILKRNSSSIVLLTPFTILFVIFTILPIASAIVLSFTYFDMLNLPRFIGFTNYIRMFFDDDVFLISIKNTLIFAFVTGPIGYLLSFIFAWFINEFNRRIRAILTLVFYAPSLAANVYFIWTYIFAGDSYGFANYQLMNLGLINQPIQWLTDTRYNMYIVIAVVLWMSMGVGFLAFVAGLQGMDSSLYEAGAIDGVKNRFQELWYITLPQMVPQLLFGAVMTISTSFAVGYESMALTGFPSTDYSTHTMVLHIMDLGSIRFEMGYASALAVFLFAVMILAWLIISRAFKKMGE